ncbi:MAG: GT-D fold domain-containing glycosyltransferase [Syntrophomonadaceae bacterium]|nr:GT-D fold domain-containing glycosyltransferase [Syntrophomonadaceae bacterium]MDD3022503.1 GT-D fold domain-containing glycosyltransferase [Syntrophomonadaceae bacterium]
MQVNSNMGVGISKPGIMNINNSMTGSAPMINLNSKSCPSLNTNPSKALKIDIFKQLSKSHSITNPTALSLLSSAQLMDRIILALEKHEPLSVISIGATEAFVMAQYSIFSEQEFMSHPEAQVANQGIQNGFFHRGIRFPNIAARDDAVEAVGKADIVGYNTLVQSASDLTQNVLNTYNLQPELVFEANLRRVLMFSQKEKFEAMLAGKKILLIGSQAPLAKRALEERSKNKLGFNIVGAISIFEHEEIAQVKKAIKHYEFDLCLLAAGVNALILAPHIATSSGKVAFDIGWGMQSLITGEIVMDQWLAYIIGIERIMRM